MKTTYFEDYNLLGMELKNMQDVLNAHNLGLHIKADGGEEYLDSRYDEELGDWRDATTEELIEEAQVAFRTVGKLYGVFDLPADYRLAPAKATTLQTDFKVGQEVYLLVNNKITKAAIKQIWLEEGKGCLRYSDYIASEICNEFYARCQTVHHNSPTFSYICDKIDSVRAQDESFVSVGYNGIIKLAKLSEVFATKEELVKHLLED